MFYRNVGFLRYWTLSNLPLFLLAAPMLCFMLTSGLWARNIGKVQTDQSLHGRQTLALSAGGRHLLWRLAIPQIVLALLAITNYHVQIITRLSSGYPVWYWWLATLVCEDRDVQMGTYSVKPGAWIVRWMTLYSVIQGGLYASFLPPA